MHKKKQQKMFRYLEDQRSSQYFRDQPMFILWFWFSNEALLRLVFYFLHCFLLDPFGADKRPLHSLVEFAITSKFSGNDSVFPLVRTFTEKWTKPWLDNKMQILTIETCRQKIHQNNSDGSRQFCLGSFLLWNKLSKLGCAHTN